MIKIRKLFNNTKFILILQIILLLIPILGLFGKNQTWNLDRGSFVHVEDEKSNKAGYAELHSEPISCESGVYKVSLQYETDVDMDNVWSVSADNLSFDGLLANTCMLYAGKSQADMYIWLTEQTDSLYVEVKYAMESQMTVHSASIQETNMGSRMLLVILLAGFVVWDVCLWKKNQPQIVFVGNEIEKSRQHTENRVIMFCLTAIIIAASVPLLAFYEIAGADTVYHLLRIEGIKDGLLAGQFPVRIQPNWLQGYGYATGIFYCDTYLYIPAFLRIMGFPVGAAYLIYKGLVNIGTVLLSYYSFTKIFKSKWAGIFGSMLYSLNIYRLLCLYLKDHLGQYTAMMFLPLLAYSIWRLLADDTETKEYKQTWIVLTISATCIVQCHILTCELAVIFCVLLGLIFAKKIFRKQTLWQLAKAVLFILGINMWFLVPFVDYMLTQHLNITGESVYTRTIQGFGSLLPQMFGIFALAGGSDKDVSGGMEGEIPFTIGIALLIALVYFLYLWACGKVESKKMKVMAVLSLVSLYMATVFFPWDGIQSMGGFAAKLVSALQYPTRLLEIAAVFLTLTACSSLMIGSKMEQKESFYVYVGSVLVTTILVTGMFYSSLLSTANFYKLYDENAMGNAYLSGKEYLPVGTDEDLLLAGNVLSSGNVQVSGFEKDDLQVQITCENDSSKEGYVELPLLYYKGYEIVSETNKAATHEKDKTAAYEAEEKLQVTDGDNHVVRVVVPADFNGTFEVDFVSPWYWRVAEVISVFTLVGFIICGFTLRKK